MALSWKKKKNPRNSNQNKTNKQNKRWHRVCVWERESERERLVREMVYSIVMSGPAEFSSAFRLYQCSFPAAALKCDRTSLWKCKTIIINPPIHRHTHSHSLLGTDLLPLWTSSASILAPADLQRGSPWVPSGFLRNIMQTFWQTLSGIQREVVFSASVHNKQLVTLWKPSHW